MKNRFALLILCILIAGVITGQESLNPVDSFKAANQAYTEGDYFRARSIYEAAVESGIQNAAIYFNLATILYQEGQIGDSLLYFRRAQHLEPRNTETNKMIARIRAERVNFQGDDHALVDQIASSTIQLATNQELMIVAFILWNFFFVLVLMWFLWKQNRKWLQPIVIILGFALLLSLVLWIPRQYAEENRVPAVVTAIVAPVMSGPGDNYLELYRIYSAAEIRLLETKGDWHRFVLPDGREGWIRAADIAKV